MEKMMTGPRENVNRALTFNEIGERELDASNERKVAASGWKRMVEGIGNPAKYVQGLSLIAGYAAGEAYSIYAVFGAHALTPVTAYLVGQTRYLQAVSGKYREVLDLDGLLSVLLVSLAVFTVTWCIVRTIAWILVGSNWRNRRFFPYVSTLN